jgi:hypothetical protein
MEILAMAYDCTGSVDGRFNGTLPLIKSIRRRSFRPPRRKKLLPEPVACCDE